MKEDTACLLLFSTLEKMVVVCQRMNGLRVTHMPHAKLDFPSKMYMLSKLKLYVLYDEYRISIYQLIGVELCL